MQTRKELSLPRMNSYGKSNISSEIYISGLREYTVIQLAIWTSGFVICYIPNDKLEIVKI